MSPPLPPKAVVVSRTGVPACCNTLAFKVPDVVTPPAAVTARYLVVPAESVTLKTSAVGEPAVVCLTPRPVMLVVGATELAPLRVLLPVRALLAEFLVRLESLLRLAEEIWVPLTWYCLPLAILTLPAAVTLPAASTENLEELLFCRSTKLPEAEALVLLARIRA